MSLLEVVAVHTFYGDSHVLQGVSLSSKPGEVTTLVGRNGAGKTTLIRSIIGFTPPRQGKVILAGQEIQQFPAHVIARRGVGLVPQGRRIFPSLTVREQLRVAARPGKDASTSWTMERVLDLFPRLKERLGHFGSQLSGGEQQMLAVGRALMTNPQVLLLDEPSEGLAPLIVQNLARAIAGLAETGLTVVLVEQNLPMALSIAHTAYVMSKGRIVFQGPAGDLARNEAVRRDYLGV